MTALKFERLKVTLATCFPKIYQTDTKLFAKEQGAARHTHASPTYDLNAANGVPNDADQRKNGQKLAPYPCIKPRDATLSLVLTLLAW